MNGAGLCRQEAGETEGPEMIHMNGDSTESGSSTNQESLHHDWREEGTAAGSVINAIVALTEAPPTRLQPLYETIDPDALEKILELGSDSPGRRSTLTVSFCHEGCDVTIKADGQLTVRSRTDEQ